jgi:hypothetical protein
MLLGCSLFLSRWWQHDRASRSNCRKSTVARPRRAATDMGGLCPCKASTAHRSHSAVCTEIKIWKGSIGFSRSGQPQDVGSIGGFHKLEFEKSASNRAHGDGGFPRARTKHQITAVIPIRRFFTPGGVWDGVFREFNGTKKTSNPPFAGTFDEYQIKRKGRC